MDSFLSYDKKAVFLYLINQVNSKYLTYTKKNGEGFEKRKKDNSECRPSNDSVLLAMGRQELRTRELCCAQ